MMISNMINSRSDITDDGSEMTPLYVATCGPGYRVARYIISLERDLINNNAGGVPSYNMDCFDGGTPTFSTESLEIVEDLLQFDDLEVTRDDLDDNDELPLLWRCAEKGIVSQKVAVDAKLRGQFCLRFWGTLPLEEGERIVAFWTPYV